MATKIVKDTLHITYRSLGDFFRDTKDPVFPASANIGNKDDYERIQNDESDSWRYGAEYTQDNYFIKRFDKTKGYNLCEAKLREVMSGKEYKSLVSMALTYKKKLKFTDNGGKISVSRALAGEDTYFVKTKNAARPVVKLAINIGVSACVSDDDLVRIASNAIPVVYALESAGICTEIWLCAFTCNLYDTNEFQYTLTEICIKTAQQRFNWTMFAPTFQSGVFRHSIFLTWLRQNYEANGGYGYPMGRDDIEGHNNYGFAAVIGANSPGPVQQIEQIFSKIKR